MLRFFAALLLSCSATMVYAQDEISERFGSYEVFYSAFNSSFLSPSVAKAYGFVRGKDKALMNIAVIKHNLDGTTKNVAAAIKGEWSDLIHTVAFDFKRIQEEDAVYYLAPFDIQHKNDMYFTVTVFPEGANRDFKLTFKKRLYVDGKD
ncbi:MAG: DUF4426 domain-containing protein [Sinobacterium sp.]|nr:DUF4426 domain-containing protein [Sinobacterium sp.]